MNTEFPASLMEGLPLGEKIANELRIQIIGGKLEKGSVLSENQIAADFGTSRGPVRDALKTLSNEGLIRLERMGVVILGLTPEDMQEIYDVRILIEGFIMERLSHDFNESRRNTLLHIIDKMELAAKHNDDVDFSRYDMEFHETMIRYCNHQRIFRLWNGIRPIIFAALLVATKNRFARAVEGVPQLIHQHRSIVDAISEGDQEHIRQAAKDHYTEAFKTVSQSLFFFER
ncbi:MULTISPECIES: GntR family transcriptional regulator [Paenibacillus]|uniref:GntR family transcriptional regulator n=1 Tax=Paenibacillus naphthalenovorans TaxID=162209 RepID=A0A0U2MTZ2_9BACL|nr:MULTISPECIES: GntR family transcriptional regulator [Paenibacillus]ALS20783.1 GntR family transcriptional regulator [Paenibacillus naphthalenovorans]GCL70812.1 GntR family transcriptional regulator [Paenibacillus naphthalenovorans]